MRTLRRLPIFGLWLAMASLPGPSQAGPRAQATVQAEPEPEAQYAFLIGDWDVAVTLRRPERTDLKYQARWHNHWMGGGRVVMQEWDGPYAKGLELRSYSRKDKKWHGKNIYQPDPGEWYDNTAEFAGSEMVVTTRRSTPAGGEAITREIYHNIQPDRFSIRSEVSTDGGKSWQPGRYAAEMTRSRQ